ncbi:MAG TPA: haloacid dehalogenase-like hydrolase [Candidatus Pullichristensenella excrementigallinarum]|uniref:Haloacid dehalogenase-like hydrolase n=1 Tax=Candidatus Pullichristensenella excrementigallinarum TaxID=2840907 RepID=A0A9D1IC58_9FIRM|nr:haloacid dehalogenase-like hydrolase [Candidatus Pullichristensenella excrementigallinarum]
MMPRPIVALIYDFDKTLSPKDMQEYGFLPGINMEPEKFWGLCRELALRSNMDGILAYMYMMQYMARGNMELTRESLQRQGAQVEFFPGVETWFDRINAIGEQNGVCVEHYIISSGLLEIIEGSRIGKKFKAVFAASFCYDDAGRPIWPATAINYTAKTQYLFRINKGILDVTNDQDLNAFTPEYKRRVPFSNMIYVADGMTDVPCMKMTKQKGGYSIAVHAPGNTDVADDLLRQGRADFAIEADYREGRELEQVVTELIRRIRVTHELSVRHARQVRLAHERRGEPVPLEIMLRGGLAEEEDEFE